MSISPTVASPHTRALGGLHTRCVAAWRHAYPHAATRYAAHALHAHLGLSYPCNACFGNACFGNACFDPPGRDRIRLFACSGTSREAYWGSLLYLVGACRVHTAAMHR